MPLITTSHDSLPYIDPEPTPTQRAAAQALIDSELQHLLPPSEEPTTTTTITTHPLLPPLLLPTPTAIMANEYTRLASSSSSPTSKPAPLSGIDTSRYEALTAPAPPLKANTTEQQQQAHLKAYTSTLSHAHTTHTYLLSRLAHLQALDSPDPNPNSSNPLSAKQTWLTSNATLVSLLSSLEKELQDTKEAMDKVALARQGAQQGPVGAEMALLERSWRDGVARVLETEVAAEELRGRVLEERRRRGVVGLAVAEVGGGGEEGEM